tara:strand:+ start:110 stop:325 length:216 start_codon:yes stop_codon:yes gene_type:complete
MIYINDNTIGVVKIPIKSPNFIQSLFGRTRDEGIKIPKKRNIIAIAIKFWLKLPLFSNGKIDNIIKNTENT